jgi:cation transport regulator
MPYESNEDLPLGVRTHLPLHAQDIFRETFNSAWTLYSDPKKRRWGGTVEETARRVAWAAVKRKYRKLGECWVEREDV